MCGFRRKVERRQQALNPAEQGIAEADPQDAADRREQQALGQQHPHQPPAMCAERETQRDLTRSQRRPRHQHVREVGASDQQHRDHGAHQHAQGQLQLRPDDAVDVAIDGRAPAFLDVGVAGGDAFGDRAHLGLRLLEGDARLQPRHGAEVVIVPRRVGRERERRPEVGGPPIEFAVARKHADDGVGTAIQQDVAADDARIGAEQVQPQSVAQNSDLLPARLVFVPGEGPSERRLRAEDLEVRRRDERDRSSRGSPVEPAAALGE